MDNFLEQSDGADLHQVAVEMDTILTSICKHLPGELHVTISNPWIDAYNLGKAASQTGDENLWTIFDNALEIIEESPDSVTINLEISSRDLKQLNKSLSILTYELDREISISDINYDSLKIKFGDACIDHIGLERYDYV